MDNIWFALWFFLPAGIANGTPVLANKIPYLNRLKTPMDFGQSYRGKRIFGDNKTWRGLLFSSLMAGLVGYLTFLLMDDYFVRLGLEPSHPAVCAFAIGLVLGAGALIGDAVESFFKRQAGRKPGSSWFPFDQIDYILGGLLFISPVVALSAMQSATIIIVWFFGHLFWAFVGYKLKLKDTPI